MEQKETLSFKTPIGVLAIKATQRGISAIQRGSSVGVASHKTGNPLLMKLQRDLQKYFKGKKVDFSRYPLDLQKTTLFQQRVWKTARTIAYGTVRNYGWIAQEIGRPKACRAVGNAMGANPFLIVVPCHRVIAAGNKLGGFGSGIKNKVWLLRNEGRYVYK